MMKRINEKRPDRSGVALILVVGLLALMMVMGVTFSVYMRTERVAAGNFKSDVKARQLLHMALSRALAEIDSTVGTNSYPPWDVINSTGSGDAMSITNGSAWGMLPTAVIDVYSRSEVVNGVTSPPVYGRAALEAQWIDVNQGGADMDGRVAYLVLNCSGLLDANYMGILERGPGINVQELQVTNLSDVMDNVQLTNGRNYLTQQELAVIGTNTMALTKKPANFVTFSAFPKEDLVYVGGTVPELVSNKNAIIDGFYNSGEGRLTWLQAGTLFTNLVDYVDGDSLPGNLGDPTLPSDPGGPFVEPMWMINEVALSNNVTIAWDNVASNYIITNNCFMWYELVSPFRSPSADRFVLSFSNDVQLTGGNGVITNFSWTRALPPIPTHFSQRWQIQQPLIKRDGGPTIDVLPSPLTVTAFVRAWVSDLSGIVVDKAMLIPPLVLTVTVNPATGRGSGIVSRECNEARLNHEGGGVRWASTNKPSLGTTNKTALTLMKIDGNDGDIATYVRNAPLVNAGELGFLFYGIGGQTIRLYKHGTNDNVGQMHRVLDYFTCDSSTSTVSRGKVHLGTRQREVMMAAFTNMPVDDSGVGFRLLVGYPEPLLDKVINSVMSIAATNVARGGSLRVSDLGATNWAKIHSEVAYAGASDLDVEAIVRNSSGLFGVRQNYFIILLYAQSTKVVVGLSDRSVVAGVRAVAEVWRDPVKNAQGRNPIIIRSFRILNE